MIIRRLVFLILSMFAIGCGVKGKPLPPTTPREIGIGKPQYEGVDKEMKKDETQAEKKKSKDNQ